LVLPATGVAEPLVRVRVLEAVGSVLISAKDLRVQGKPLPLEQVHATAEQAWVRVADLTSRQPVQIRGSGGVTADGRRFPGSLSLVPRSDGSMDVINVIPLEPYVARAAAGEVYGDWPEESLKAQVVVTRTYALHQRARHGNRPFDLEATVISQKYATGEVPARVAQAAAKTRGQYLSYNGQPVLAAFHSSAGGRTASSHEVWGRALPYLRSVSSPDDNSPDYFWSFEISFKDLADAIGAAGAGVGPSRTVRVMKRGESSRVQELAIGAARLSGRELRQVLGGRAIRSALFDVRVDGDAVRFLGSGAGHGVGLSQWGAHELGMRGKSYRQILAHYFPGTSLKRLDGRSQRLSALP
jgi:stage II sporulation protein D